jgi:hypothetical protein
VLAVVVPTAVVLASFSSGALGAMAADRPASPAVLTKLRTIMESFARQNGEPHPTNLRMVETTSTIAWSVLSPDTSDNQGPIAVYVVVANGHFIGMRAPPGHPAPRGTTLYVLLERNGSYFNVGWGLSRLNPDLRKLGAVQKL